MGTPAVRQRPDADGQGLVSDTASRIANLSLPGRSAWLPPPLRAPPLRQPAWPAMAGRSAWTGAYGLDNARSFERPGALAGGARRPPAAAAPATASGARTPGWPEPRQIMLEISEDQKLDLNSGAQQRLLALEQLSFTLAMDDDGNGYSGLQRLRIPLNLGCRLGQGILFSKPFQAEQLDYLAQGRRKNPLKAAGTLAVKTAAAGARADVDSCRPGEPSQQIAEIRTA